MVAGELYYRYYDFIVVIRIFPVNMWRKMNVCIAFFNHVEIKSWIVCKWKRWSKNNLTVIALKKGTLNLLAYCAASQICTKTVPMLKLLSSHIAVFKQYQKKYCILHIAFISSVASSNKCSEFNFISLFHFSLKTQGSS